MELRDWSPRRLTLVWVAGIALQLAIIIIPTALTLRRARREWPRLHQQVVAQRQRVEGSRLADSISRAEQMASARATGTFHLRANGETVFAVVGMPADEADPKRVAAMQRSIQRTAAVIVGIEFGAIPFALALLTLAWVLARRETDSQDVARRVV